MTKFKIFLWLIISSFLGLVMYQNRLFFLAEEILKIDIHYYRYETPGIPIALIFISVFFLGWLIAFFSSLSDRFKSVSQIKKLQKTIETQQSTFEAMKKDIDALKLKPVEKVEDTQHVADTGQSSAENGNVQTEPVQNN